MRGNLSLLIGENKQVIDFNIYEILNDIDYDDNNKIIYDMNVNSFMDVLEEASMVSLFSPVKVIIVNNFSNDNISDSELEYLERFINSKNKDVYLILIGNKIDGRKKNYKVFKDNFKIIDVDKVDNNNIYELLSKIGNDINNINSELDKLFIYKDSDKKINKEDIDLLILDNIDNVIYEFTNAILDEDIDKVKSM